MPASGGSNRSTPGAGRRAAVGGSCTYRQRKQRSARGSTACVYLVPVSVSFAWLRGAGVCVGSEVGSELLGRAEDVGVCSLGKTDATGRGTRRATGSTNGPAAQVCIEGAVFFCTSGVCVMNTSPRRHDRRGAGPTTARRRGCGSAWNASRWVGRPGVRWCTLHERSGWLGPRAGLLAGCLGFLRVRLRAVCDASGICHGKKVADFGPTSRLPRNDTFFSS
jgi:hypothetical protein